MEEGLKRGSRGCPVSRANRNLPDSDELPTNQKKIRYFDVQTLIGINAKVVLLTREDHRFTKDDKQRMRKLLIIVRKKYNRLARNESIIGKASFLMFGIASGQHFHEGNKRTAVTAGETFLKANGCSIDIKDNELVDALDKASVGKASLSKLSEIMRRLIRDV